MKGFGVLAFAMLVVAGHAHAAPWSTPLSNFCDRNHTVSAADEDRALRFAAAVEAELDATGDRAAIVSRSGLDLSRFDIRHSHAAVAWRDDDGTWSARQLYLACDEHRPRLYDQGLPGFAMGIDDPHLGYIAIVRLGGAEAEALRADALDTPRALDLVSPSYSADAYPFSTRHQNCNQWVVELLATDWGDLADGTDLRERAQAWLRAADYRPTEVDVRSPTVMLAGLFMPVLSLEDHPLGDRAAHRLRVTLPASIEALVHERLPHSERIELCHDDRRIVIHHGWTPIADGCRPGEGDRVIALD